MMRISKSLVAGAVAAAALVPFGAPQAQAMAACQVKPLGTHSEFGQLVAVFGFYNAPAGAIDVELTCGIVRQGVTAARVTDPLTGPVAALAAVRGVGGGSVSSCYEVVVTYADGSVVDYVDTCP